MYSKCCATIYRSLPWTLIILKSSANILSLEANDQTACAISWAQRDSTFNSAQIYSPQTCAAYPDDSETHRRPSWHVTYHSVIECPAYSYRCEHYTETEDDGNNGNITTVGRAFCTSTIMLKASFANVQPGYEPRSCWSKNFPCIVHASVTSPRYSSAVIGSGSTDGARIAHVTKATYGISHNNYGRVCGYRVSSLVRQAFLSPKASNRIRPTACEEHYYHARDITGSMARPFT